MNTIRNHQRTTKAVKLVLALSILITARTLFIYTVAGNGSDVFSNNNESVSEISRPLNATKMPNYELTIKNSVFEGLDKDSNPYKIIASNAIKVSDQEYHLERITAQHLSNDKWLLIHANKGSIDDKTKQLTLEEQVKVIFGAAILTSEQLQVNLADKTIKGSSSVSLNYNNSKITANHFISSDNNIIKFQGNVVTKISTLDF